MLWEKVMIVLNSLVTRVVRCTARSTPMQVTIIFVILTTSLYAFTTLLTDAQSKMVYKRRVHIIFYTDV